MIRTSDLIVYPSRATAADALDALESALGAVPPGARVFLIALDYYATRKGVDFAVIASHAANECDLFRDARFQQRRDAFGIGVTEAGVPGASFASYDDAAFYAVAEYCLKLGIELTEDETNRALDINLPKFLRVLHLAERPEFPRVTTIAQMNTKFGDDDCWWMCDPNGPIAIVEKSRILFPNLPDQTAPNQQEDVSVADVTFGKVPLPDMQVRDIAKAEGNGWNDLGKRNPYGVVLHRMLGTLRGTDGYFRLETVGALTDYGVGVAGPDAASDDGLIMRWNDPRGRRAGWASGPVSAPYGDGLSFVNRFGINAVNRDLVSIEISGHQQTALTAKARASITGLMAYWADQAEIPWDRYPIGPHGFSAVYYHQEFTIGTGKQCPFSVVMNETAAMIEQTRGILKRYQTAATTTPKPPTYAAPHIPDWMEADLKAGFPSDHTHNGVQVFAALREYTATKATKRFQNASTSSEVVGPPLKVRERFTGWYVSTSPDGKHSWIWTPFGTRLDASALTPRVSIKWA